MRQMKMHSSRGRNRRPGFILMEVVVAITLLALVMTPLAAMVFKITARSHRIIGSAYRNGVLMEQVNLLESLPFDSLAIGTTTTTFTAKPYLYTKKLTISLISQVYELKAKKLILIISPTNPLYKPDTTIFVRSSASTMTTFTSN
jgi:pilin/secretion family protein with methylation motif